MKTGWVDEPHACTPPTRAHASVAKYGAVWRCECWTEWRVWQAFVADEHGFRRVDYTRVTQPDNIDGEVTA